MCKSTGVSVNMKELLMGKAASQRGGEESREEEESRPHLPEEALEVPAVKDNRYLLPLSRALFSYSKPNASRHVTRANGEPPPCL